MHIAGRLALQSPMAVAPESASGGIALNRDILRYHGCDIVVRQICERGFEADLSTPLMEGALVRLRLPGAGAMLARVTRSASGRLVADFINPVSTQRLKQALGMSYYGQNQRVA